MPIASGGRSTQIDSADRLRALRVTGLSQVIPPGDAVLVGPPGFYLFYRLLARLGLRAVEVPSHCCDGINVDVVRAILKRNSTSGARIRAALVIGNFANPIGSLMPDDAKRELHVVCVCLQHDGIQPYSPLCRQSGDWL